MNSAPTFLEQAENSGTTIFSDITAGQEIPKFCQGQRLVVGRLLDSTHFQFEVQNPNSDAPTCPTIAFHSPVECLESLEKCLHYTTGFQFNSRQNMGSLNPMGFELQMKVSLDKESAVTTAAGWPDCSGSPVFSVPFITDTDKLMVLLSSVLFLNADCLVTVVQRLNGEQLRSLARIIERKTKTQNPKWLIVFHDLKTKEEYEVEFIASLEAN